MNVRRLDCFAFVLLWDCKHDAQSPFCDNEVKI